MVSKIRNGIFIIFSLLLIISLTRNIFDYQKKIQFYKTYKEAYQKEEKKNLQLKSAIQKSTDYYSIERAIREKLNLLKPGEIALILPSKPPTPIPTPVIKKLVWQQWIDLFVQK